MKNSINVDRITYRSKSQDFRIRFIILHYTNSEKLRSIDLLTNKDVSCHYLITEEKDDPIYCLVNEEKRAWHAGKSGWGNFTDLNDISIGIEIVNKGLKFEKGKWNFKTYTHDQIEKTAFLVLDLIKRYNIEPQNILGHSDIAPQRKDDPGPLFPWKELYQNYGIGMWCNFQIKDQIKVNCKKVNIKLSQMELKKFGYNIQITNKYDNQTKKVIRAFQYHFYPEKHDGVMDTQTYIRLRLLNEKYKNSLN